MRRDLSSPDLDPPHATGWTGVDRACLVASGVCDAIAAGVLLLGTPLPAAAECIVASLAHACALLFVWSLDPARASRRWLNLAVVAAIPCLGVFAVATVLSTRGRGPAVRHPRSRPREVPILTEDGARRLASALSPCDALERGDMEERLAALSTLTQRADAEAIALLRWVAAGHDPDHAVSAALALDRIGEYQERGMRRPVFAEARRELG